jgi:ATP-binding cassette subfamily F protein uup
MEEVAAAAVLAAAPAPSAKTASAADARAAKKELQKIERQLDKVSEKESKLHAQIADNATDFEKVAKLDAELRQLIGEREELELRWLELAEDA